jgi:16S rRNA (cytidine1402-2'-O)-methyltransferase
MPGVLYVVATPLGNLEDFSSRAIRILAEVDLIACEDTRRTRRLLSHFNIRTPTTSYHEHNEATRVPRLIRELSEGKQIALVSDAGTPLLSDPGYHLIHACRAAGIPVYPIPGPSASTAALSVSGLPTNRFLFEGFLPRRAAPQRERLRKISRLDATLVIYLPPHGLLPTLQRIQEVLGNRQAFLVREMTKLHETHYRGSLQEILKQLNQERARGEYTLVLESESPSTTQETLPSRLDVASYVAGLKVCHDLSQKDAIGRAARDLGLPKRKVYKQVIKP